MPCMKCSNGKWKYGEHGNCQFDTLSACKAAAAAIHIGDKTVNPAMTPPADPMGKPPSNIDVNKPAIQNDMPQPDNWHCDTCECAMCKGYKPM